MASAHANLVKGITGNKHLSEENSYSYAKLTRQQGQLWHLGIWSLSQLALWCSLLISSSEMASTLDTLYLHMKLWHEIFAHRSEFIDYLHRQGWLVSELLIKRVERQKRLYSFSEMAFRKEGMGGVIKSRKWKWLRRMKPIIVRMLLTHFTWTNESSPALLTKRPMSPLLKPA